MRRTERIWRECNSCNAHFSKAIDEGYSFKSCPSCGKTLSVYGCRALRTEHLVSVAVWFKPWTWGQSEWRTIHTSEMDELERILHL